MKTRQLENTHTQRPGNGTRVCSACHRLLPLAAFAPNGQGRRDTRCKECQRLRQRLRRLSLQQAAARRPLITTTAAQPERMRLILQALQTVNDSIQRRRRRQHLQEFCDETGWSDEWLYECPMKSEE